MSPCHENLQENSGELETSLIVTKFNIPPARAGLVARPRLLEKMLAAANANLTLVSAPAGFGKTTLLSEWIHHSQPPLSVAWFSIEGTENDPIRFWEYLVAALKTVRPEIDETTLQLLRSPQPLPIQSVLISLVNDLSGSPRDSFLVLDDYYFINAKPIHEGVLFLLEHLPPRLRLVIATRKDPPLPLARFRGKGMLLEIRADDLRFTEDEATALFCRPGGPALTPDNIRTVNDRTEGWVAGLEMAILAMQGEKDIPAFISSFTGTQRYIMDYLFEEVLQRQPPELREFLLKTSVLDRLSGPLCDTVTKKTDGREMISRLENDNLFVVPLEASGEWYRYEHLFAGLLRHRLEQELGKEAAFELQRKAGHWYETNGYTEHAIDFALEARDWEKAMDLVSGSNSFVKYGGTATHNWLSRVPREMLLTRSDLCTLYVWSLGSAFRFKDVLEFFEDFKKSPAYSATAGGSGAALRAYVAGLRGDPDFEERALEALDSLLPDETLFRALLSSSLAVYYNIECRLGDAERMCTEAIDNFLRAGDNNSVYDCQCLLMTLAVAHGKLTSVPDIYRRTMDIAGPHPKRAYVYTNFAVVLYYWNELDAAEDEIQKALSIGPGSPETEMNAYTLAVALSLARGDSQGAEEALEKGEGLLKTYDDSSFRQASIASSHVLVSLAKKDTVGTAYWLDRLSGYENESENILMASSVTPTVMYLLFQRSEGEARARLQKLFETLERENYAIYALHFCLARAFEATDPEEALSYLADALAIAAPEGIIRPVVEFGPQLVPLLRNAILRGIEPDFARKVVSVIEAEERQRKIRNGEIPVATASILSERELEVLRLIAEGLTNRQIAEKLFISLPTVKIHVRHILDKLDALGRTQAIARARELNIL
jgi:LuxR family maltose regulon positive regulatory protein